MRISTLSVAAIAGLAVGSASAYVTPVFTTTNANAAPTHTALAARSSLEESNESLMINRRSLFQALGVMATAAAALPVQSASASLLDEYGGSDPTKIGDAASTAKKSAPAVMAKKEESVIEPNLRSNYYYPTNKKRYLPRIKRCNDAIPDAAAMIGEGDWEGATDFATKVADDTILPMKLYTSSLTGGGTNVKVSFTKDMSQAANDFEKAQKKLVKALAKKDQSASSTALEDMSVALQSYRTAGRLLGPDGGGDIPSVDEIRRSACRVQGRSFEKKIQDRDARVSSSAVMQS